ncbi:hypothetical protein G9F72_022885 [Clostridium estertheticum]|uniref:hypothetical protein n=1 Tax=Clostridium estertheticum TaxID=238834 RepID=UPI001CD18ABF|nr:hypothetical protein [Clostridium estertheticum]MBZ9689147.1 hypothetical protein [Clostridium estertheticum]
MGIKEKNASKKSKGSSISIVMFVVASVVALIGVALLVNNILLYKSTVSQAVTQGYDIATVRKALLTSQLLPGVFEPIGIYGGIAFLILGVGIVNKKVSKGLMLLTKEEVCNDIIEESIVEQDVVDVENIEATEMDNPTEKIETVKEIEKN